MLRKPLVTLMAALVLGVAFCVGVAQLFVLRYEGGDVYPPYCSLRADPLGGKALYEALGQLGGVEVQRNYKPLPKLKPPGPITLVYAGVARYSMWDDRELLDFNALVLAGTRALFTFQPIEHSPLAEEERQAEKEARLKKEEKRKEAKRIKESKKLGAKHQEEAKEKEADAKDSEKSGKDGKKESAKEDAKKEGAKEDGRKKKGDAAKKKDGAGKDDEDEDDKTNALISFREAASRWGFAFDYLPADEKKAYHRTAIAQEAASGLETEISWHSALCFKGLKPEWKVLYRCDNHPVIIERKFGSGSLVFAADSFFVSNEALRSDRSPKLLAYLFDGPANVVFDEEHNGVREEPGMATLARKYRLHGVVGGLLLLTVLFVWKNAVRFLPAHDSGDDGSGVVAGKESAEGFVNLLRRTIKPADILGVCIGEWRKAFPQKQKELARVDEIFGAEQARPSRERNAVAAYQAICRTLVRKR